MSSSDLREEKEKEAQVLPAQNLAPSKDKIPQPSDPSDKSDNSDHNSVPEIDRQSENDLEQDHDFQVIESTAEVKEQIKRDTLVKELSMSQQLSASQQQQQQQQQGKEEKPADAKQNNNKHGKTVTFEYLQEAEQEKIDMDQQDIVEEDEDEQQFNISLQSDEIEKQQLGRDSGKKTQARRAGSQNRATQRFTRTTTMKQSEIITRESFEIIEKLGEGSYATVWLVKKKDTGKLYGMKVLEKQTILKFDKIQAVYQERDILEFVCDCNNIIQLELTFQDTDCLYFLMEYANNGSLSNLIKTIKPLPHETCKFFIAEIVLALEHLHTQSISHRDIKPENILLDDKYHIKICDFGEAKIIKNQNKKAVLKEIENYYKKNQPNSKPGILSGNNEDDDDDDDDYPDLDVQVDNGENQDFDTNPGYTQQTEEFDPDEFVRTESIFNQCRFDRKSEAEQEDLFDGMFNEQETESRMTKIQNKETNSDGGQNQEFDFEKNANIRGTFVGTPLYASPEMLSCSISGNYSDLWALGVIVYQLFNGEVPWKGNQEFVIFQQILDKKIEYPNSMPVEVVDLVDRLLNLNPYERLGAGEEGQPNDFEALKSHKVFEGINFERMQAGLISPPIPIDLIENMERIQKEKSRLVDMNLFDDVVPMPKDTAHTKAHWLGAGFKDDNIDIPPNQFKISHQISQSEVPGQFNKIEESKVSEQELQMKKMNSQKTQKIVKQMQILMEGEVEKKKGKSMFSSNKKYWMLLTNQPRLFLLSEFKIVKDEPVLQTYQKDILLYPQMRARLTRRNQFQIECPITNKKHLFKADYAGDWVRNINLMIEKTSSQAIKLNNSAR